MPETQVIRFGAEATRELAASISAAKGEDAMAPVRVLVPRARVGLATRRWLATGEFDDPQATVGGVVNVSFTTMAQFAAELSEFALSAGGRLPATTAVRNAAARRALKEARGSLFSGVEEHPGTIRALVRAYDELRAAPAPTLARLAEQSARAHEVVGLVTAMREQLAGWYDDTDVLVAATEALGAPGRNLELPAGVVVFLPRALGPGERALLAALAARVGVKVLIGITGDPIADASARALLEHFGAPGGDASRAGAPEIGTSVVSAPSADVEVLSTMRAVMGHFKDGEPLERMAIAFSPTGPYRRIVREALSEAGIPFNGVGVRTLASTVTGRLLLGLFELVDHDWPRDEFIGWLAGAPVIDERREVAATKWDRLTRRAGVVGGLARWFEHLDAFEQQLRDELAAEDAGSDRASYQREDLEEVAVIRSFLETLAARFEDPPTSWAGWARWCEKVLVDYLGSPARRRDWRADEAEAYTAVREALEQLTVLDAVDPEPTLATFRGAFSAQLDALAPQTTRFANGVMVGSLPEMLGLDLEVLFVLGMHDGSLPPRRSDDPLVPDRERQAADPELPLRAGRVPDAQRDYLAALASARRRVLSFARGDQSEGRVQRPSRWLLSTLSVLTAQPGEVKTLYSRDLEGMSSRPGYRLIDSLVAVVRDDTEPSSLADRDLRELLLWHEVGRPMLTNYLAGLEPDLGRGLSARRERRSTGFTRFDGHVEGLPIPSPATGRAVSTTRMEEYAKCPRRYFFSSQLGLRVRERPEEIIELSDADRGNIIHKILERFFAAQVDLPADERIAPNRGWDDRARRLLFDIALAVFADYERRGLTGRPVMWRYDRRIIEQELAVFLVKDASLRAEYGSTPEAVEFKFGPDTGNPVIVTLANGRRIAFHGVADRLDRTGEGALVIDYKSGKNTPYIGIGPNDWFQRGTKLQLPVYALAARDLVGGGVPVEALYFFVGERGEWEKVLVPLNEDVLSQFSEVLSTLVEGIEAGVFPGRPGAERNEDYENCTYCPFASICPNDRAWAWDRKREVPALAAYVALAEDGDAP